MQVLDLLVVNFIELLIRFANIWTTLAESPRTNFSISSAYRKCYQQWTSETDRERRLILDTHCTTRTREIQNSLNIVVNALNKEHVNKSFKFFPKSNSASSKTNFPDSTYKTKFEMVQEKDILWLIASLDVLVCVGYETNLIYLNIKAHKHILLLWRKVTYLMFARNWLL